MQMTRRDFLRSAAMSAALAAVAGPAGVARAAEANTPEKWVKGVCRYCGTGCGVLVGVKNGKAVAIKGVPLLYNVTDDIMVMYAGQIVEKGTAKEMVFDPLHPYSKGLMGSIIVPEEGVRSEQIWFMHGIQLRSV